MEIIGFICLLCILIGISAFLSASETALFSLSSLKVSQYHREQDSKKKLVSDLLQKPRQLLVSLLILNVAVNLLIQTVFSTLLEANDSFWISAGLPLILVLLFGELFPKAFAIRYNQKIALFVAPTIKLLRKVLMPIRIFLTTVASGVSRILFFFLRREKEISLEELKLAIKSSKETGLLSHDEVQLIRGYLDLDDHIVKELMRCRHEIVAFDIDHSIEELYHAVLEKECSKIPVYQNDLENILGIITVRELFMHADQIKESKNILPYLKKPFFVPESVPAKQLMQQLHAKKEEIAIVVDEHGSCAGLITIEDLMEVVVGPIEDKIDEPLPLIQSSEDVIIVSGQVEITEIEHRFDVPLPSPSNMVTIGGWLTESAGDLLKSGDRFIYEPLLFHVLSSDEKKINRMYIRRLPSKDNM